MEMCLLFLQVLQKYHNDITIIVKTKSVSLCKTIERFGGKTYTRISPFCCLILQVA